MGDGAQAWSMSALKIPKNLEHVSLCRDFLVKLYIERVFIGHPCNQEIDTSNR